MVTAIGTTKWRSISATIVGKRSTAMNKNQFAAQIYHDVLMHYLGAGESYEHSAKQAAQSALDFNQFFLYVTNEEFTK
jgi:hypothetical protein